MSTLLRGTAEAGGKELVFSDKVACAAADVLKELVGGKEEEGKEERKAALRDCGVLGMVMGRWLLLLVRINH